MADVLKFIGKIEKITNVGIFYNFRIHGMVVKNEFVDLDEDLKERFRTRFDEYAININYTKRLQEDVRLEVLGDKDVYMELMEADIEENYNTTYKNKISYSKIKKLGTINEHNWFRVVSFRGESYKYSYPRTEINDYFISDETSQVYLCIGNSIFGKYMLNTAQTEYVACDDGMIKKAEMSGEFTTLEYRYISDKSDIFKGENANVIDVLPENLLVNRAVLKNRVRLGVEELEELKERILQKDSSFTSERTEKVLLAIKDTEMSEHYAKTIFEGILSDEKIKKNVFEKILNNASLKDELLKNSTIEKELEYKQCKLHSLNSEIENKTNKLNDIENSLHQETNKEIQDLEKHRDELENECDSLEKKIDEKELYLNELQKNIKSCTQKEKDAQNRLLGSMEEQFNKYSEDVIKVVERLSNIANESVIEEKIRAMTIEEIEYKKERANMKEKVAGIRDTLKLLNGVNKCNILTPIDFVNEFYTRVRQQDYDITKRDLINVLICLRTGFLTVFSGKPGCGKSTLGKVIGTAMGLEETNRFLKVSVEKGWTSKRDFMGFYNSLNKTTVCNNNAVLDAFEALHEECSMYKEGFETLPYIILLDEANLSPMEYYWADFMDTADLQEKNRRVKFPNGADCYIPKSLRFIATINNDDTTVPFSPRLLDRAWIVNISTPSSLGQLKVEENKGVLDWSVLAPRATMGKAQINSIFSDYFKIINASFSRRVLLQIEEYLKYSYLFGADEAIDELSEKDVAYDYIISQKILPLINGWDYDYRNNVEEFKKQLENNNGLQRYPLSNKILNEILNSRNGYSYFSR